MKRKQPPMPDLGGTVRKPVRKRARAQKARELLAMLILDHLRQFSEDEQHRRLNAAIARALEVLPRRRAKGRKRR